MNKIKLDSRLSCVASLVNKGRCVIDVGTDHAYVPAFLVEGGICPYAIACDVKTGPLENARDTVRSLGLEDKIKTVLSDGLDSVGEQNDCDIIFAGMGGILISELLSRTAWVKKKGVRIIAQPMSHPEAVREYFLENGFEIAKECTAVDGKHYYCVIVAEYTGKSRNFSAGYIYFGRLFENDDDITYTYLQKQYNRLKKRYNAIRFLPEYGQEAEKLKIIIDEFNSFGRNFDADS